MSTIAITRDVSPSINNCELSFRSRKPIDLAKAVAQHNSYRQCLEQLGAHVVRLPAEPGFPDSVFVEDAAVVFDEIAVIPVMGAASRRDEIKTIIPALCPYRELEYLHAPATLDGGDVLRAGKRVFVGLSNRTNEAGFIQLRSILQKYGYAVDAVRLRHVLHLKSAVSYVGDSTVLINRSWLAGSAFAEFQSLEVPHTESAAANVLSLNGTIIIAKSFPDTAERLEQKGFSIRTVDVSELQKAEAGVTCCSLILSATSRT
ncbi:MAG: dimethylarginine dimethylaminohydrolase family protein [Chthoniobacterales bacterium]